MAGPILRLKALKVHTGLSRSTIYKRMKDEEDFPKSFSLGGGAVGWFKDEVDAWLEASAAKGKSGTPTKKALSSSSPQSLAASKPPTPIELQESSKQTEKSLRHTALTPERSTPQSNQPSRPGNLGEAIVEGGKINARLLHYLQFKTWTPAIGALLICGINPPPDCHEIPDGGVGLDEKLLHTSNERFHEARRIFKEWYEWKDDSGDPALEMEPLRFLEWCMREDISTEWLPLFLELVGFSDKNAVDLTASRFALLTSR